MMKREREGATSLGLYAFQRIRCHLARAFRSVVDRLLCMLKVKGSNPLMSKFFLSFLFYDMLRVERGTNSYFLFYIQCVHRTHDLIEMRPLLQSLSPSLSLAW